MQSLAQAASGMQDTRNAARAVFGCVRSFAASASNPVLALLKEVRRFEQGRKYPQPPLAFGAGRWRAYYHSHPLAGCPAQEHGHFHLFVLGDHSRGVPVWTHLAALAMDREGQPLRWFATNRWVTGGAWGERDWLVHALDALAPDEEPETLQRWLAAMAQLYRPELAELLEQRDAQLARARGGRAADELLGDRRLYELAEASIDLGLKLTSQLRGEIT